MARLESSLVQHVEPRFSLAELEEASGVPERTIRQFITAGLVPPALGRGRARYFTPDHLQRLELVARMRGDRLSIDEIRSRLLSASGPDATLSEGWRRLTLHPDLELHIRDGAPEAVQTLAAELAEQARRWFGEE
jgi:DNA-binding transcriptional MerR regulator